MITNLPARSRRKDAKCEGDDAKEVAVLAGLRKRGRAQAAALTAHACLKDRLILAMQAHFAFRVVSSLDILGSDDDVDRELLASGGERERRASGPGPRPGPR